MSETNTVREQKRTVRADSTHVILTDDDIEPGIYRINSQHRSYDEALKLFKELPICIMGHTFIEKVKNLHKYKLECEIIEFHKELKKSLLWSA